jgi:hypothetical protein
MINFKFKWAAVTFSLALAACGGGGGGGDGAAIDPITGGPVGGPGAAARTGRITFGDIYNVAYIDTATKTEDFYTQLDGGPGCDRSYDRWRYLSHSAAANGQVLVAYNCDYLQQKSKLVIYNPDKTIARTITNTNSRFSGVPEISPSGQYILATFLNTLQGLGVPDTYSEKLIDIRSTTEQPILTNIDFFFGTGVWASDDTLLLTVGTGFKIWKVGDAEPGALIPNTPGAFLHTVSPDGKRVAFLQSPNPQAKPDLFTINIDGSDKRQLTKTGVTPVRPAFSPNGTEILIGRGNCDIAVFGIDPIAMQVIPADSTMLDVPDVQPFSSVTDSPYALRGKDGRKVCTYQTYLTWK